MAKIFLNPNSNTNFYLCKKLHICFKNLIYFSGDKITMKHIFKKISIFILILILILLLLFNCSNSFADDIEPDDDISIKETEQNNLPTIESSTALTSLPNVNARSCIVLDRLSKKVLYGKNEYNKVKMASTTKIMTAIIVIENCDLNKTIQVSKKAARIHGSRLGLKTNDKITVRDLLYGLMLCSGNDAAVALAETISGSISGFCNLMNLKAKELGLTNTHFESPHGLDSEGHYTTAYELALLANYSLNNPTFLNIVHTKNYTVTINGNPKNLNNTNELLGSLNGVYGVKTGFTNGANRCLVTSCKRNNMDIICVVLGCDTKKFRTQDSIKLIEYTFKNYEYVNIEQLVNKKFNNWKNENLNYFDIYKSISSNLQLKTSILDTPIIPIRKENISSINIDIFVNKKYEAPINYNDIIGGIEVSCNNEHITHLDILANNNIKKKIFYDYMLEFFKNYSKILNSVVKRILGHVPFPF